MPAKVRVLVLLALILSAFAIPGCHSGIGVQPVNGYRLLDGWKSSAITEDDLSPRTLQTLRQLDLETDYRRHPLDAFGQLHELAVKNSHPDLLFALAEMSFSMGRKLEKYENCESIAYYYLCAGYSYHYLFGEDGCGKNHFPIEGSPKSGMCSMDEAFDPRFRLACDLYNNGLAKCIQAAQKIGRLDSRQTLHMPTADGGKFTLSVHHHGFAWRPEEFGPLLFCSDYRVVGLPNHFRGFGLGVPLIGVRADGPNTAPCQSFYPREVSFPVTAFFRFEGTVADLGARRAGRLELYNPLAIRKVSVGQRKVPLETDLTTPLAYFLSRTDLHGVELKGFLRADSLRDRAGIYMFEPYQPGKIPVVMVHGLLSNPLTWTPLFNELRADPVLNKRYQFWFYLYPTGNPYLASAADLRNALHHVRGAIDPHQMDSALDQMVFVGHSMGGLVSKLMTQDSNQDFWQLVSKKPFKDVRADEEVRDKLQQVFFFDKEPNIRRVIFLATPHRGSKLSPSLAGRIGARLVRLPSKLMNAANELVAENPGLWKTSGLFWGSSQRLPTSIDLLSPNSPALELLASRPAPPQVHYHSIIGVYQGKGKESSDGVVTYASAHIDSAESELLVPAYHVNVHHHPRAMLEVRRILYEHLKQIEDSGPIIPAHHRVRIPAYLRPIPDRTTTGQPSLPPALLPGIPGPPAGSPRQ